MTDVKLIASKLTKANLTALGKLPLPRDADPVRFIAARPYGSTWRKASGHYDSMVRLEDMGIVQRTTSRDETLWRLTKPAGHDLRRFLNDGGVATHD